VNTEVRGERIDHPNDVDTFTFQDTVGAEFNAFLESSRPFMLQVLSPTNSGLAGRVDNDADTALFHHGTGPFQLTASGTHTIRIETGVLPWLVADTGAYRFILYRIDHRPELVPSAVQVGDTISGEAIQPAGDVDEFTAAATPGERLASWFRLSADPVPPSPTCHSKFSIPQQENCWAEYSQPPREISHKERRSPCLRVALYKYALAAFLVPKPRPLLTSSSWVPHLKSHDCATGSN